MIDNKHNVDKGIWSKFSEDAKRMFNDVMEQALHNQKTTIHPKAAAIPQEQWETVCHNMACYAAWSVDGKPMKKGSTVITEQTTD